jgi:hypothetical protein
MRRETYLLIQFWLRLHEGSPSASYLCGDTVADTAHAGDSKNSFSKFHRISYLGASELVTSDYKIVCYPTTYLAEKPEN